MDVAATFSRKLLSFLLFFIIIFSLAQSSEVVSANGEPKSEAQINYALKYEQGDITEINITIKGEMRNVVMNISSVGLNFQEWKITTGEDKIINLLKKGNNLILENPINLGLQCNISIKLRSQEGVKFGSISISIFNETFSGEKILSKTVEIPLKDPLKFRYLYRYLGSGKWEINASINATVDDITIEKIEFLNAKSCSFSGSDSCIKSLSKKLNKMEEYKFNVTLNELNKLYSLLFIYYTMENELVVSKWNLSLETLGVKWEREEGKGINRSILISITNKQSDLNLSETPIYVDSLPHGALSFTRCEIIKEDSKIDCSNSIMKDSVQLKINNIIKNNEAIKLNISYSLYENTSLTVKYRDRDFGSKSLSITPYYVPERDVESPFPYYVKLRGIELEGIQGAIKVGDGYLLLKQIFWPILSSDTISLSGTCIKEGEIYPCRGEISVPICGIGTLAVIAAIVPISLWAITRRKRAERVPVVREVPIPEHVDLG
jgi:hypothetical protein